PVLHALVERANPKIELRPRQSLYEKMAQRWMQCTNGFAVKHENAALLRSEKQMAIGGGKQGGDGSGVGAAGINLLEGPAVKQDQTVVRGRQYQLRRRG